MKSRTSNGRTDPWPNRLISSNRPSTRSPTQDSATTAPAEAFVIGYQAGWQEALDLCIRIETALNDETEETNEHHQQ